MYNEYETYATMRGRYNNVSLLFLHVDVNTYSCACVEIIMVVSYEVVAYVPDLAPRDNFRYKDLLDKAPSRTCPIHLTLMYNYCH